MTKFTVFGYSRDYLVGGKYIGSITLPEPDREVFGWSGREKFTVSEDVVFKNKKTIKKGTQVTTELFPLNGRIIEETDKRES